MVKGSVDAVSAFEAWRNAEAEYMQAVTDLARDGMPAVASQASAIRLGQLRYRADARRHDYFSAALRLEDAS